MKRYCLHTPADIRLSPAVRTIAVNIFERFGFNGIALAHLKLVFDEIFMNAVKYGSTADSIVFITIEFERNKLSVTFEDEGGGNKISAAEIEKIVAYQKTNSDPAKTSGRGLAQIASKWTDDLKISDGKRGGLAVTFVKRLNGKSDQVSPEEEEALGVSKKIPVPDLSKLTPQVFALTGEIDNLSLGEKAKEIDLFIGKIAKPTLLVLDLGKVLFCSSAFIAKVALWKRQMNERGGELVIQKIPANILEIFELVGLSKIITISTDQLYEARPLPKAK